MTDPRAGLYAFIETLVKENPEQATALEEHKAKLKEWGEGEVRAKTQAIADREQAKTDLTDMTAKYEGANTKFEELKASGGDNDGKENGRIIELESTVRQMQEKSEQAEQKAIKAEKTALDARLRGQYLSNTNLAKEFAELKIGSMIESGEITEQGGVIGGLDGGVFMPMAEHIKKIEANNSSFLSSIDGGRRGAPNNDPAQPKTSDEVHKTNVEKAGGSMPQSV